MTVHGHRPGISRTGIQDPGPLARAPFAVLLCPGRRPSRRTGQSLRTQLKPRTAWLPDKQQEHLERNAKLPSLSIRSCCCRDPPWLQQPAWQLLQSCRQPVQSAFCRPRFSCCYTSWYTSLGTPPGYTVSAPLPDPRCSTTHHRTATRPAVLHDALGSNPQTEPGHRVPRHPVSS